MKKHLFPIAFVAVLASMSALALGTATAAARTPTPTPTATSTPGPLRPAAPSDLRVVDSTLIWTDNSSDETEFYIDLVTCLNVSSKTRSFRYQVPANTTSFPFPQEFLAARKACYCPSEEWTVNAFNNNGETSISMRTGILDCLPSTPATPVPVAMPPTGTGGDGPGWNWQMAALAGAVALMGAGTAIFAGARWSGDKKH